MDAPRKIYLEWTGVSTCTPLPYRFCWVWHRFLPAKGYWVRCLLHIKLNWFSKWTDGHLETFLAFFWSRLDVLLGLVLANTSDSVTTKCLPCFSRLFLYLLWKLYRDHLWQTGVHPNTCVYIQIKSRASYIKQNLLETNMHTVSIYIYKYYTYTEWQPSWMTFGNGSQY